jgi:radical SAM protein with 4Fe4S-binding SPASM domain
MSSLINLFHNLLTAIQVPTSDSPSPGLYHYLREGDETGHTDERARIHLRIDPDGHGTLLVNANRIFHLNPTAALMAYLTLEKRTQAQAIHLLTEAFDVSRSQAKQDYKCFTANLDELLRPDGACPICDLEVEVTAPFSARPTAPYRMDLALTYRCNNDCAHCYNVSSRDDPELTTGQWKQVIDRLWDLSIPHIIFTGGEPTLRSDLPELIAHAEQNGQITGLNTNGRRLSDRHFVRSLVEAGLDHVQITLESHDSATHDHMVQQAGAWQQTVTGLRNVLDSSLYVMTNTTMLRTNAPSLTQTLDFLGEQGVATIGLNALIYAGRGREVGTGLSEKELPELLNLAHSKTEAYKQRLIWYTPTQYCRFDPMQMELGVKSCTAALYNMCIEPDGGVIPCQSYYQQVGNILSDPWGSIWNHELCLRLRERQYVPDECRECALLAECGGGCPLQLTI